MGEVYLAQEQTPEGARALVVKKVLPHLTQNTQFVGRFLDEARVVVRLAHPNIARVYAMGEVEGQYYLAMEYVQGKTVSRLSYRLRELGRELPVGIILLLAERLCQGLDYAHDATDGEGRPLELVHRDLSPANVCVSYRGEVKVIDFGAAQSTVKEQETAPRVVIGNLAYMAPEQARKRFVDRRADIYSVGVLVWELLTQRFLPQKGDPVERWRRAAYPNWEAPSTLRAGVTVALDAVVLRALSSDPDGRPATAAQLGDLFRHVRLEVAPDVTDAALGALLSEAFAEEKAAEDRLVASLLGARATPVRLGDAELPTDPRRLEALPPGSDFPPPDFGNFEETAIIPPTALAFEHSAIAGPADFVPDAPTPPQREEVTDPGEPPFDRRARQRPGPGAPTLDAIALSEVGFGVTFGKDAAGAEETLVREIQGRDEESLEHALMRQLAPPKMRRPLPPLPRALSGSTELPLHPAWAERAADPEDEMEEPLTSPYDGSRALRFGRIAAAVFLAALLFGFAVVWMLGS